jgi:uroporphyrinogen III methyltransferase/synthase
VSLQGTSPIDATLARLHEFRGIVFGCAAGVEAVVSQAPTLDAPVIAVGVAAAQALSRHRIADFVSVRGACQEALNEHAALFQKGRFLLITSEEGRPNLRDELMKIGAEIEAVATYRSVHRMPSLPLPPIDLVVLPSSSAAHTVLSSDLGEKLRGVPMAAIGPQTEEAARRCGAQSVVRAEEDSVASLVSLVVLMAKAL